MSLRDEMKDKLREGCAHCRIASKGRIRAVSCALCEGTIDALMPLVERAAKDTIELYKRSGLSCAAPECWACKDAIDAIVARVLK